MKLKKWMLIILLPITGFGTWLSYVHVNKHNTYPYPDIYNMLVNKKCERLLTSDDGTVSQKRSMREMASINTENDLWIYSVNRVINKREYEVKYFITPNGRYSAYDTQEGNTLIIVLVKKDLSQQKVVEYSNFNGVVQFFSGQRNDETNYEAFEDMLSNDVESCKN